jgi:ribonuclease D
MTVFHSVTRRIIIAITVFKNDIPDDFIIEGDLAIDTETMGLNILRDRLCLLQLSNGDGNAYLVQFLDKDYSAPNLKKLLSDPARCIILHYARFDVAVIKHYLGIELTNIFCTKIASKLVRTYTEFHGLKELCRELLGIQISKQQQSSYWGKKELSNDQKDYAAKDVLYLHQIRKILEDMLRAEGYFDLARKAFDFLPTRAMLDLEGWAAVDIFSYS